MKPKLFFFTIALSACLLGCSKKTGNSTTPTPMAGDVLPGAMTPNPTQDVTPGTTGSDTQEQYPNGTAGDAQGQNPENTPTPAPPAINTDTTTFTYLVNREYTLSEDFVPEDLETPDILFPFSDTTIDKAKMTKTAGQALARLFDAAFDEEGLVLYGISAYRSYARQYTIYAINLAVYGVTHANRYSAAPGTSEHQTGLSIDISCRSEGYDLEETFADTPEGIWVAANAHRFGFILRYPKGKEQITGYAYEPWHLRYVGEELAAFLYETGLTLDEYYGVSCSLTEEYLNSTPLIDTTTERYQAIYNQYH